MIVSVAHPEPSPDGGAQLVRDWDPTGTIKADIVLVHGLGEHSGRYARTGSLLAEAGYRVRGFDLLGFGASSGERADIARWSLFLDQVEGNLQLGQNRRQAADPDGPFAGRPDRPGLCPRRAPSTGPADPFVSGPRRWQRLAEITLRQSWPGCFRPSGPDEDHRRSAIEGSQGRGGLLRGPAGADQGVGPAWELPSSPPRTGCSPRSESSTIPTLVIHGGQDTLVPTASSEALTSVQGLVRRVFPDLRHETMNEPEGPEVVAEIIDWIASKTA